MCSISDEIRRSHWRPRDSRSVPPALTATTKQLHPLQIPHFDAEPFRELRWQTRDTQSEAGCYVQGQRRRRPREPGVPLTLAVGEDCVDRGAGAGGTPGSCRSAVRSRRLQALSAWTPMGSYKRENPKAETSPCNGDLGEGHGGTAAQLRPRHLCCWRRAGGRKSCTELGDEGRRPAAGPRRLSAAVRRSSAPPAACHPGARRVCARTAHAHAPPCPQARVSDASARRPRLPMGPKRSRSGRDQREQVDVTQEYCSDREAIKNKPSNRASGQSSVSVCTASKCTRGGPGRTCTGTGTSTDTGVPLSPLPSGADGQRIGQT